MPNIFYQTYNDIDGIVYGTHSSLEEAIKHQKVFLQKHNMLLHTREVHVPEHPIYAVFEFHDVVSVFLDIDKARQELQKTCCGGAISIYNGDTGQYVCDLPEE